MGALPADAHRPRPGCHEGEPGRDRSLSQPIAGEPGGVADSHGAAREGIAADSRATGGSQQGRPLGPADGESKRSVQASDFQQLANARRRAGEPKVHSGVGGGPADAHQHREPG